MSDEFEAVVFSYHHVWLDKDGWHHENLLAPDDPHSIQVYDRATPATTPDHDPIDSEGEPGLEPVAIDPECLHCTVDCLARCYRPPR